MGETHAHDYFELPYTYMYSQGVCLGCLWEW